MDLRILEIAAHTENNKVVEKKPAIKAFCNVDLSIFIYFLKPFELFLMAKANILFY